MGLCVTVAEQSWAALLRQSYECSAGTETVKIITDNENKRHASASATETKLDQTSVKRERVRLVSRSTSDCTDEISSHSGYVRATTGDRNNHTDGGAVILCVEIWDPLIRKPGISRKLQ